MRVKLEKITRYDPTIASLVIQISSKISSMDHLSMDRRSREVHQSWVSACKILWTWKTQPKALKAMICLPQTSFAVTWVKISLQKLKSSIQECHLTRSWKPTNAPRPPQSHVEPTLAFPIVMRTQRKTPRLNKTIQTITFLLSKKRVSEEAEDKKLTIRSKEKEH